VHERIAAERIADLDVAVDASRDAHTAALEVAHVDDDGIGIAIRIGAKADVGRSGAPA
jgi:hypothetical protein